MYSNNTDNTSYSSFSLLGQTILESNKSIFIKCLEDILKQRNPNDVITLADYGTADGGNVIDHMNGMIEFIHSVKGEIQEVLVVLEDQQFNDFNVLFRQVKGINENKFIKETDSVHLLISGTSMYHKCLPTNFIDLGCSTIATHWNSFWPVDIKDGISVYEADDQELAQIKKQAASDWKHFVVNRGREMKSGGFFLVSTITDVDKKEEPICRTMTLVLQNMVEDNFITKCEFRNINVISDTSRPLEDLLLIFSDPDVTALGLHVVSSRQYEVVCVPSIPEDSINASSLEQHAEEMTKYIRVWSYSTVYSGLSHQRDKCQRTEITDECFNRLRRCFVKEKWINGYRSDFGEILFRKK